MRKIKPELTLPTWEDCEKAVRNGEPSALEQFIYENEPYNNALEWRQSLLAVLDLEDVIDVR
jgi:hypothetical protein